MELFITNLYLFVIAVVLAILEIQIEGPHGWAKNLPTWRPDPKHPVAKLYSKMMSGKELTGYHTSIFTFVFLIFHLPYVFGLAFTLEHWLQTMALFFIFIALWDFLWFVLNPYYPLKSFVKDNPNHQQFFLGMPTDYYYSIAISLSIALLGEHLFHFSGMFSWWLEHFVLFIVETVLVIFFSLYILDIDNWHKKT